MTNRPVGCLTWLFLAFWPLVFTPFMLTALGPVVVPSLARLAAPIVCDRGYVRSEVTTWSTPAEYDGPSDHWQLHCIDPQGATHPAPDAPTWVTLFVLIDLGVVLGLGSLAGAGLAIGLVKRILSG